MFSHDDAQLGVGLHSFNDDTQAQSMGHGDDRRDDLGVFFIGINFDNETAIDFQRIDGKAAQITEGRIIRRIFNVVENTQEKDELKAFHPI